MLLSWHKTRLLTAFCMVERKWTPKNEEITEANIEQVAEKYNMLVPSSADSSQLVAIAKV